MIVDRKAEGMPDLISHLRDTAWPQLKTRSLLYRIMPQQFALE
jgi:hypothetical protein